MIFTRYLAEYEKLLQRKYSIAGTIWHKGERGRQRENGLLMFLREMLPAAYGVATGEVIPYIGKKPSPQCDIIIYDRLKMPIFGAGEAVQQVPLEGVYAVIESKSVLDSKAIADAKEKFSKIKSLPRCPRKKSLKKGFSEGPLFILFGYRFATQREACEEFMNIFGDTNVGIAALDKGVGIWVGDKGIPPRAVWLLTTEESRGFHETLAVFLVGLLDDLRTIDLGTPNFNYYIGDT